MDLTDKGIKKVFKLNVSRKKVKQFKKVIKAMRRKEAMLARPDWVSEDLFNEALIKTKYIDGE